MNILNLQDLALSQNERMEGVEEQVWQDWIVDTYFNAMDSASRKIEIHAEGTYTSCTGTNTKGH